MLSFVTNDNVVLRYSDTGNGDRLKWNKDPLILVCAIDISANMFHIYVRVLLDLLISFCTR